MFGMFANAGSGALGGARFTLINVLPGAFLVLIIVGAYRTHLYDSHGLVNLALALPPGWEAVELGVAMVLMGVLAQPFQIAIVRMLEGYGPNEAGLLALKGEGIGLVITVDCGAGAVEPLTAARDAGLDVVVLDHHSVETAPPAVASRCPIR